MQKKPFFGPKRPNSAKPGARNRSRNNRGKDNEKTSLAINDEITEREPYNGYVVLQGGVPEVDEFLKQCHK